MRIGLDSAPRGPEVGDVIAGKYRLDALLGRGGMGVVYAAWHTVLEQKVAIKFLTQEMLESPLAVARFLREGRAAAKIRNEHVARVLDVDTMPPGIPYMVLEYLNGCDLAELLSKRGALPVDQGVDYVMQALE